VESTALFFDLMREQQALGTTVMFSTHLLGQVELLCSHVAVIHLGKLVAQGELPAVAASVKGATSLEQAFLSLTKAPSARDRLREAILASRQ